MQLTNTAEPGDTPVAAILLPIDFGVSAKLLIQIARAHPDAGNCQRIRTESEIANPKSKWMVIYKKA